ncbi:hypothetical protein C8T65DRAFT_773134 [Cerioporus squamosus]|nr:hypothetical protein C8T65DRAFT_773134 [Cerioporus squamosus]
MRQPRLAITASFLLIDVFIMWLILPRHHWQLPQDDILPIPIVSKVVAVLNSATVSGTVTFAQPLMLTRRSPFPAKSRA